nr:Arm11 [uncultured bacterium]
MAIQTDTELGRSLLTERSMQWLYAHGGDPYALLLRAEGDDRGALASRIRELGPVYRSRTGAWVTGSHRLGVEILSDPRLADRVPDHLPDTHLLRQCAALPSLSAAARDRLRARAELKPRADVAERVCADTVGRVGGGFDLVGDLLRPAVVSLVGDLFAVPRAEREVLRRGCGSAAIALDATFCPPRLAPARALMNAVEGLRALFRGLAGPDGDLPAAGMLACVVGVEVSVNVVANGMLALLDRPAQWRLLGGEPELAHRAVEETLRHDPPIRLVSRIACEDLELAGQPIDAGDEVVVFVDSANRDPAEHPDPDRFDLSGPAGDHLSLSGGPYLDLVAPLARTAAAAVLRVVAARLPHLRRTGPVVRRLRAPATHAILRFPVSA